MILTTSAVIFFSLCTTCFCGGCIYNCLQIGCSNNLYKNKYIAEPAITNNNYKVII